MQFRFAAPKTTAQGVRGKNMRQHAQRFDMTQQRQVKPHEAWMARHTDPIQIVERNAHVRLPVKASEVGGANLETLLRAGRQMGCPTRLMVRIG